MKQLLKHIYAELKKSDDNYNAKKKKKAKKII